MKILQKIWARAQTWTGGEFKPFSVLPGGHPTIPYGEIIAKPRSDGGYSLSVYHGIELGWMLAGEVDPGEDVHAAMQNLLRPVEVISPNANNNQGTK